MILDTCAILWLAGGKLSEDALRIRKTIAPLSARRHTDVRLYNGHLVLKEVSTGI